VHVSRETTKNQFFLLAIVAPGCARVRQGAPGCARVRQGAHKKSRQNADPFLSDYNAR